MEASELQNAVFDVFNLARQQGLMFQHVQDALLDGKHVRLEDRPLISFGSCSYLGLETDVRLKEGIIRAAERYGSQFSASRGYLSAPPYPALEEKLSALFGAPTLITSTTTLGHLGILPVLAQEKDAILLDHQVHHSVQLGATLARANGAHVELVRHGDAAELERRVAALCQTHRKVWHCIDGVYSMFGDLPDAALLKRLLDTYEQLHLYVDDAHGMSIAGLNGRGMHLSRMAHHPRMVVATSLNKAFAASGGCFVFPNEALRERARLCASTLAFCGPIQPPMLGAIGASADIHLSPEISRLQAELGERVAHFNQELLRRNLPLLEQNAAPIFFLKTGPLKLAHSLIRRLMEEGFYITVATYPAVPLKRSGLRISLTRHHSLEDLTRLADSLERHYPLALEEVGMTREGVESLFAFRERLAEKNRERKLARVFELAPAAEEKRLAPARPVSPASGSLQVQYSSTIHALDAAEWDRLLGHRGTFSAAGLAMLERTFRDRPEPENNWRFHYLVVRDGERPVAATFFTETLWKDDMLMRAEVSRRIEAKRAEDPYFLTSRAMAMGSLLSEGNHLYLDRSGPWQQALALVLEEAGRLMREGDCRMLVLRDLPDGDADMDALMLEHGTVKVPNLTSFSLDLTRWNTLEEFQATLTKRSRKRLREDVLDSQDAFQVRLWRHDGERPTPAMFGHFYELYRRVKARKFRLNTFDLPADIFERLWETQGWELLTLHLSPQAGGPQDGTPVAVVASYVNGPRMVGFACGLDGVERPMSVYRQMLWRMALRAKELGCQVLELGMDAEQEKARLGCDEKPQCSYALLTDHFNAEIIGQLVQEVSLAEESVRKAG